jgi:hypothetical protein
MANQKPEPINFEFEGETIKTYRELFEEHLPESVAQRAIYLMGTSAGNGHSRNEICSDIYIALQTAFVWGKTKEGAEYWDDIYENLN